MVSEIRNAVAPRFSGRFYGTLASAGGRLREGLNATARIILLGLVMDTIYQILELQTFHPNEALIVALLLVFAPYVVMRGVVARVAGMWRRGAAHR